MGKRLVSLNENVETHWVCSLRLFLASYIFRGRAINLGDSLIYAFAFAYLFSEMPILIAVKTAWDKRLFVHRISYCKLVGQVLLTRYVIKSYEF